MTVYEVFVAFKAQSDASATAANPDLPPELVEQFLNHALSRYVNNQYYNFETTQKVTDDLERFVKHVDLPFAAGTLYPKSNISTLPDDYRHLVSLLVEFAPAGCAKSIVPVSRIRHMELGVVLTDPLLKPKGMDASGMVFGNEVLFFTDATVPVSRLLLGYLSNPEYLVEGTNYSMTGGPTDWNTTNWWIPDSIQMDVIKLAVQEAFQANTQQQEASAIPLIISNRE